jgi:hypothetical protein
MKDESYLLLRLGARFGFPKLQSRNSHGKKEPKSTSRHSCLEPHKRLNVIDSRNFRCFVGLSCCGSSFLKGLSISTQQRTERLGA